MNNPQIYSDGVVNSIQDSPLRVQNKILGALKNMGGAASTISTDDVIGVTATAGQALAANASRKFLTVQNVGTSKVYIRFGSAPTIGATQNFSYILAPASGQDEGDGGVMTLEGYIGSVWVVCAAGKSSTVTATDFN
jgi:hypothetical protein